MVKLKEYLKKIYKMRYFWGYLARCDIIARNRRSKLGMIWIVLSPFMLTVIMAVVLGTVFKQPIAEYIPYIQIGMIFWDLFVSSFVTGGGTFFGACPYIMQFNHPLTIYTLKTAVVCTVNFLISLIGAYAWILFVMPQNILMGIITLPLTTLLMFLLSWAGTTVAAFLNTKYRDYPQIMALFTQGVWYMSPVFFQESMFQSNKFLSVLFQINPITHMLYLLRKPLLYGELPSVENYLFSIGFILIIALIAYAINKKYSKKIIFYL